MESIPHNKTFVVISYKCDCCGYETSERGNSAKHNQTKKCPKPSMKKNEKVVMAIDDVLELVMTADIVMENNISKTDTEIEKLRAEIDDLSAIVKRQKSAIVKLIDNDNFDDDDDCEGSGLIYFVKDTVVTDRGKIGRTKNTDVKKLKSRYSTFGSPRIQCYFSMDIKTDEAKLKARLREVGCMQSNTEMVTNCDMAIRIFCEFASE
jgi:hypothetical protein